jgi:hypothetical protein
MLIFFSVKTARDYIDKLKPSPMVMTNNPFKSLSYSKFHLL